MEKAKQKRTVADMRITGTAMFSWLSDQVGAAAAGAGGRASTSASTRRSTERLCGDLLTPQYIETIPVLDGWKVRFSTYLDPTNPLNQQVMAIGSGGRDQSTVSGTYTRGGLRSDRLRPGHHLGGRVLRALAAEVARFANRRVVSRYPSRMRRRSAVILPAVLAAGWLLSLLAPLLSPGRALANRDIRLFHLPLRPAFRELAALRAADVEPLAARRPAAPLEPQLRGLLSAELAGLRGAARTTRSACSPCCTARSPSRAPGGWRGAWAAAAARRRSPAVGYAGCGAYLSLLSAFTLFCSMAWFPWVLAWADRRCAPAAGEPAGGGRRCSPAARWRSSSSTASRRRW